MQIHQGLNQKLNIKNAVVTSGTFDGVHLGHQHILKQLNKTAKETGGESVVITFWPHPKLVINPNSDLRLISDLDEKIELLKKFGIDHVWIIPFNRDFSLLTSSDFIQKVLINGISTSKLVIGYDHKFGKNREGSFEYLVQNAHKYPFSIEEIRKQTIDEMTFSSTLIRKCLSQGNIEKSNKLMGHRYHLTGTVIKGLQNGNKMGFPTANIHVTFDHKLIPADSSYAVKIRRSNGSVYLGMLNIGNRPTLNAGRSIEVHLIDFNDNLYGEQLQIEFHTKLRDEKKFDSIDQLKKQLTIDKQNTRDYFNQ